MGGGLYTVGVFIPIRYAVVVAGLLIFAIEARAQQADVVVRVRVIDSANAPVGGADVSIVQGLKDVRASGVTDAAGVHFLHILRDSGQRELVARKIGFARANMFFFPRRDTIVLTVTMHRVVQKLETVKVSEREDLKRKSYHVDADEIENATRPILDGLDVITKLKPDIISGRMPGCGWKYIWVNGKLIQGVIQDPMVAGRVHIPLGRAKTPARRIPLLAPAEFPNDLPTIMASIKPEHIEEMNFLDCFDMSIKNTKCSAALYVVLKDGIGFDPGGRGSYVLEPKETKAASARPYRARLLGLYDEMTGDPIAGASVSDTLSGITAMTTATGTISLLFLPEGTSTLKISKPGYNDLKVDVSISPKDTLPVTLVLSRPQ